MSSHAAASRPDTSRPDSARPGSAERGEDRQAARLAMAWHGFGSPVGLGILIVCVALAALLLRLALTGV